MTFHAIKHRDWTTRVAVASIASDGTSVGEPEARLSILAGQVPKRGEGDRRRGRDWGRGRWERKIESMRECVCRRRLRLGVTAVKNECDANVASAVSIRTIEDYNISIFLSDEYKI